MLNFLSMPKSDNKIGKLSHLWQNCNEIFKIFLGRYSWFVYVIAGLVGLFCIYCCIHDYKRRLDMQRRRTLLQRATERTSQRRRPGAIGRDHEIFRNALKKVHQYTGSHDHQGAAVKSYIFKITRSGNVYGSYSDFEN